MDIGITFAPFDEEEWDHFTEWAPLWRIQRDQYALLDRVPEPMVLAIVHDQSDLDALLPRLSYVWGVELGNEPDFKHGGAERMNQWYKHAIPILRDTGWGGPICTAGVANLHADTLAGAAKSLDGIWPDVLFAWHAYDDWRDHLGDLMGLLDGRPHLMSEWGYANTNRTEAWVTEQVYDDLLTFERVGAAAACYYQLHDGPPGTPNADFGLHARDDHWRLVTDTLEAASRTFKE